MLCSRLRHDQSFLEMEAVISLDSRSLIDGSSKSNWTEEEKRQRLDQLSYDTFQILLPSVSFVMLLLVIGLSGNLLVFFVYFRQFSASATRVFVLAMTACDMTINVFGLPRHIILMRYSYRSQGLTYCRLVVPIGVFPILMSCWLLVCVAFDRRDRICNPLHRHLSPRQATCLLLVPFTLTSLAIFPFIHLQEEGPFDIGIPGLQGIRCTFPTNNKGVNFNMAYVIILGVSFLIILDGLIICYGNIFLTVIKRNKLSYEFTSHRSSQQTWPHVTLTESPPSGTSVNAGLKMLTGSASAEVKTSQKTMQCDANTNFTVGVVKDLKTEESPAYRHCLGKPKTKYEPKHRQNLVQPETNETNVSRQDYQGCSVLPVSNNNHNGSGQMQNQEDSEKPEAIFQEIAPAPSSVDNRSKESRSFEIVEEDGSGIKPGTETLATPSLQKNVRWFEDEGSSSQGPFRSTPRKQSFQPVNIRKPRTTLMMFALTMSTLICWTPYFIVELSQMSYVGVDLSPLTVNILFLARAFPSVNSVINPFIYNFFSPRFQMESIRFLTKLKNSCSKYLRLY